MSRPIPQRWQTLAERTLAFSVLAILLLYDFALFVQLPYRNFNWDSSTGRVVQVYVEAGLQPEDRIIQIGSMLTSNFQADLRLTVLNDTRPGQVVPLVIQRGDQQLTIPWTMPGFNQEEFLPASDGVERYPTWPGCAISDSAWRSATHDSLDDAGFQSGRISSGTA